MESSIFAAEAYAIDLALDIISIEKHKKFIILSDSLSVLLSLNNKKLELLYTYIYRRNDNAGIKDSGRKEDTRRLL